jgi:hypothetical protein
LGLNEYLAEQTARFAYERRWATAPGLRRLIGPALQSARNALRDFFKSIKAEGLIKSGTKFSEWMEGLSRDPSAQKVEEGPKAKEKVPRTRAAPKAKAEPKLKKTKAVSKAEAAPVVEEAVPQLDHNAATNDEQRIKNARAAVAALVRDGTVEANSAEFKRLSGLIRDNDWIAFSDEVGALMGKNVSFEMDVDEGPAEAREQAKGFYGKFKGLVKDRHGLRRALRFITNLQYTTMQAQQLAHLNPDDAAMTWAAEVINNYERYKGRLQSAANTIADRWQGGYPVFQPHHLTKEQASWVSKFLKD